MVKPPIRRGNKLEIGSTRTLDKSGFCSIYDSWVEHCKKAWDIKIKLGKITKVEEIFLAGMGGSVSCRYGRFRHRGRAHP